MMAKRFSAIDWYDSPLYYDIIFDVDTDHEADFLEDVWETHGTGGRPRLLEPACGGGRLIAEMGGRGYTCSGFDVSEPMLEFARRRCLQAGVRADLYNAPMEAFSTGKTFGMAFCLLSSFKYLLGSERPRACLERIRDSLEPGGLFVLGIHLSDYGRTRFQHERWVAERDGVHVVCNTRTWPPDRRARKERLRNRLTVSGEGIDGEIRQETTWDCRTYDASQLRRLIASSRGWEIAACYDFFHDIGRERAFDDSQEDLVVVLRKVGD